MVKKVQEEVSNDKEPGEKSTAALVISGYTFVIGNTKNGEVTLRLNEINDEIYMSPSEAMMLSYALRHAVEEMVL
ncbi:hypothetical protein PP749_gp048 [Rhizobium phage RHEph22]|uniref:Uncharacterized protein n=1 Tax=Rhizobium phage RHEph22 TaxID=2836135 RepID=A0AAE8AWN6_9CAUD|nr:hypothetical protein PP749_gp048 [Rhizobium phage RHEph22]QXV74721.1 hypothetical protein [Rhizobium phage RHEph22]